MPTVILTEAAAYEVKDMLKANEMQDGYLKIKVNGGGCTHLTLQVWVQKKRLVKMMKS